jgi:hypothetical protein
LWIIFSIQSLQEHMMEDREAIVQLQEEIITHINALTSSSVNSQSFHFPVDALAELCVWLNQASIPVAVEIESVIKAHNLKRGTLSAHAASTTTGVAGGGLISKNKDIKENRQPAKASTPVRTGTTQESKVPVPPAINTKPSSAGNNPGSAGSVKAASTDSEDVVVPSRQLSSAAAAAIAAATAAIAGKQPSPRRAAVTTGTAAAAVATGTASGATTSQAPSATRSNSSRNTSRAGGKPSSTQRVGTGNAKPADTADALASVFKRNANSATKAGKDAEVSSTEATMSLVAGKHTTSKRQPDTDKPEDNLGSKTAWSTNSKDKGSLRDIQNEQSQEVVLKSTTAAAKAEPAAKENTKINKVCS